MKTLFLLFLCLAFTVPAQSKIQPGAKVFIHPMEADFDKYLAAAFTQKKTPVVVVTDPTKADFEIKGTSSKKNAGKMKTVFGSGKPEINASIEIIDKSSVVAYSTTSHKADARRGYKSAAEELAKNLKEWIEKDGK